MYEAEYLAPVQEGSPDTHDQPSTWALNFLLTLFGRAGQGRRELAAACRELFPA